MAQAPASGQRLPKIQFEGVDVVYDVPGGRLQALSGVNLQVWDGEFVCLVGASGCGKTTLLHVVAGLLSPTTGRVLLDGRQIGGPGADRTMVFQNDAVFPWLTVEQNVEYGLRLKRYPQADRQAAVQHYLQLVGLERVRHLFPRQLSGGMRKRVDMARAFANDPQVLLMDEPFGMLDAMTKSHLQQETLRIWEGHRKTVCFVTHDLEEALFLADRIILMEVRPGRIHRLIPVSFARPRDVRLKTTPEFQEMRRELLDVMARLAQGANGEGASGSHG